MASYVCIVAVLLTVHLAFIAADGYGYGNSYGGHGYDHGYGHKPGYAEGSAHAQSGYHYGHYHYTKTSCADHYKPGAKNAHYKVYSASAGRAMKVYCDFTTEPGYAYTLVMSSSAAGRDGLADDKFTGQPLSLDMPVNPHTPNREAYRQTLKDMTRIKTASKVWRITCTETLNVADTAAQHWMNYLRVKISDADPLVNLAETTCVAAEYVHNENALLNAPASTKACSGYDTECKVGLAQKIGETLHVGKADPDCLVTVAAGKLFVSDATSGDRCEQEVSLWFGKPVH